jgi:HKD family nuclease
LEIHFHGQPFELFGWSSDWIKSRLNDTDITTFRLAVAWVKRSGLVRLQPDLSAFRTRGGTASVIVGIDEGGATKQGLELALGLFNEVCVFYDRASRTYHPKVYLASGPQKAHLMIGSNNLTAGGLFNNYETALMCDLDLTLSADQDLLQEVLAWFNLLYRDRVCRLLDQNLLEILVNDVCYRIGDEDRPQRDRREEVEDYDGVIPAISDESVFGISSSPKRGMAPGIAVLPDATAGAAGTVAPTTPTRPDATAGPPLPVVPSSSVPSRPVAPPVVRWSKQMSRADAQHPQTPRTNPTGCLKLAQAGQDIDQKTFFRYQMFADANWTSEQQRRGIVEEAIVPFDIIIDGTSHGRVHLKIDHAEFRIADQGNTPTWLHWGPLQPTLRVGNHTGAWVIITRQSDGTYRLEITGPALPN